MSKSQPEGTRLGSLDGLRGIAALGVVFWHYTHFGGNPRAYPYRDLAGVSWMYDRGWVLVDFFFLLSGIVFTFKYLAPVATRAISARDFFALRFSRIYPLHVATLFVFAVLEWWRLSHHRPPLIYQNNDVYHFFLNLTFLQASGLEKGASYNFASWSIATEALVYLVFFLVASRHGAHYVVISVCLVLGALCAYKLDWKVPVVNAYTARGILGFFGGSLLFIAIARVRALRPRLLLGALSAVFLAGIAVLALEIGYDTFLGGSMYDAVPPHALVIFPLILSAVLTLPWLGKLLSLPPLRYLGDLSYAIYLLHVPVQAVILSVLEAKGWTAPTDRPAFFWSFIGILLVTSALVHHFFELPLRDEFRARLLTPRPSATEAEQ